METLTKEEKEKEEEKNEPTSTSSSSPSPSQQQLWINKYKPTRLEDFVFDSGFLNLFQRFIAKNSLQVLLVGKESSGKSTLLECLVREYYHPFSFVQYKENIMSMHALKEQSMQMIRKNEMKTFCQTSSVIEGKKKMMILDDLDNMQEANQKYLVNMIERYQRNVNFIASCSNLQKIALGLQSQLMLIHLPSLQSYQIQTILSKIVTQEGYHLTHPAQDLLLTSSKNKVNILIHILEKIHLYKLSTGGSSEIDEALVTDMITIIDFHWFDRYFRFLKEGELTEAIGTIFQIVEEGFSVIDLLDSMFQYIKSISSAALIEEENKFVIIECLCKYTCFFYQVHEDEIELALLTNEIFKIFHK